MIDVAVAITPFLDLTFTGLEALPGTPPPQNHLQRC
jgi:hypothetical protein